MKATRGESLVTFFYDRPESERIIMTEAAISARRTLQERWSTLETNEATPWNPRAALAAEWLSDEASVLDLGCGTMSLEAYLNRDTIYWPCDVVARDSRTIVCDFNKHALPDISASSVACLGLLEYLFKPSDFLTTLARRYPAAVVSYCITDAPVPLAPRRAHGWVNDMSRVTIEATFSMAGWSISEFRQIDDIQALWKLQSRAHC
jgi:hypothetical protein